MTGNGSPLPPGLVGPADRVLMIVGSYGSGKTEVSVNLAVALAESGRRIQISDLDLVNPYFRCREARLLMERHGIRVVVPSGAQAWADLPIVLPEVRGMLYPPPGTVSLFDVGGDDVGARALSAFRPAVKEGAYQLWQVINSRRPFNRTVDECIAARDAIQSASRLTVTGLLVNSHLIDQTTPDVVLEGWRVARDVAERTGVPVRAVAVMRELASAPELAEITAPLLRLERHMLPPWLQREEVETVDDAPLRAARPVPIGVPREARGGSHGEN